jgi:TolB-like protein
LRLTEAVRYALEGSVQRARGRMRLNVQLIETEISTHLWAERFDKPLGDLSTRRTKSLHEWRVS